jgi:hypothetical protein
MQKTMFEQLLAMYYQDGMIEFSVKSKSYEINFGTVSFNWSPVLSCNEIRIRYKYFEHLGKDH